MSDHMIYICTCSIVVWEPQGHSLTLRAGASVWMWSSYVPCNGKATDHWSLGFGDSLRFHLIPVPRVPVPFWLILTHTIVFLLYSYSEFPIFPLPNPLPNPFPIHFYSSSDPPYSELTPHSTPYPGLAKAGSTIPKSGNRWDSELKTRRSQDWMLQFRTFLGRTESHDRGEDVGGDWEGRRRGYGAVFPFPSFFNIVLILFFLFLHGFSM